MHGEVDSAPMGIANETAEGVLAHVEGERRHRIVVERSKAFVALHREAESLRYLFDRELSNLLDGIVVDH